MPDQYRVGRHFAIHVYCGDRPVATFHHEDEARVFVDAANAVQRVRELHRPVPSGIGDLQDCAVCEMSTGQGVTWPCPTIKALEG